MVAYAAAGLNARIGNLQRGADAARLPRGQRVDGDNRLGLCVLDDALHHLGRLQSRYAQHAGRDRADAAQPAFDALRRGFTHMARDEDVVHHARPERIRRDAPVAQADDEHRAQLRQHGGERVGEPVDRHLRKLGFGQGELRAFQRDIAAAGLAERRRAALVDDFNDGLRQFP